MNGIDRITSRLEADARDDIRALEQETDAQCESIRETYTRKAREEYEKRIRDGAKACELRMQRLESTAGMEARKAILAFKQELVSQAFDQAVEKLVSMPREDYTAFLAAQAARAAVHGCEELIFNAADAREVGAAVARAANALLKERGVHGGLTVSDETWDIPGGVIIKQGDIEVNCAADKLVQLCRSQLAAQVAEILFD